MLLERKVEKEIEHYREKLDQIYSDSTYRMALGFFRRHAHRFSGRRPTGVAITLFYLAGLVNREYAKKIQLAEIGGITPSTINRNIDLICDLEVDEFAKVMNLIRLETLGWDKQKLKSEVKKRIKILFSGGDEEYRTLGEIFSQALFPQIDLDPDRIDYYF